MTECDLWWQKGVIYQIYPRSFQDSNGNGIGDLRGIQRRLDYLKDLGVDALWISPIYPSPMADFGYDISNHTDIHPMFGSLQDFDQMIEAAHARGLRVILDFVPNHTSDQHPWFVESRSCRDNPKRNWYLWRDPGPDGSVPNNWKSAFGGPAWTFDPTTGQYYSHTYLKEQPDLNWRNPEVRQAMLDVLRFWMDRGVDGIRGDALRQITKDDQFRDNPPNPKHDPKKGPYDALLTVYSAGLPEIHDYIAEMRTVLDQYPDRLFIGEFYLPFEQLVKYYGANNKGCHLPFNFRLLRLPWEARAIAEAIDTYEGLLPQGAWPNWVLSNHDNHRIASRVGPEQARVAAMLLLTLRGTPTLYYGDEIGMQDAAIPEQLVQDPWEKNVPGLGLGRDPERTPMQWDSSPNGGFTTGTPWLPLSADYAEVNVARQLEDPHSMLTLHRRLLAIRKSEPALSLGTYKAVQAADQVLAYTRQYDGKRFLVALNLGSEPRTMHCPELAGGATPLVSTHLDTQSAMLEQPLRLRPNEGLLLECFGEI